MTSDERIEFAHANVANQLAWQIQEYLERLPQRYQDLEDVTRIREGVSGLRDLRNVLERELFLVKVHA